MFEALMRSLPYALINAASPTIPIAAIALMAVPGRGRRALVWYLVGCAAVVAVITTLLLTVFANVDLNTFADFSLPKWVDAVGGIVLIGLGFRLWRRGPKPEGERESRSWDGLGPLAVIGVGAYMELINLFTPPAYLTGVVLTTQAHLSTAAMLAVVSIDALLVLAPVWALILFSTFAPKRTDAVIGDIQGFFHRYGHATLIVVFIVVGVYLLGRSCWAFLT
jgi:hypothetical protein